MSCRTLAVLLLVVGPSACATSRRAALDEIDALPIRERFAVTYAGRVASGTPAFPASDAALHPAAPPAAQPQFVVRAQLLEMTREAAGRLLSAAPEVACCRVPAGAARRAIARLIASGAADELGAPRLVIGDGETGAAVLASQNSYVEGFEIKTAPGAWVGDPVIGIVSQGCELTFRPRLSAGGDEIEIVSKVESVRYLAPMILASSPLIPGLPNVDFQVPVYWRQQMEARPCLRRDDAALVSCLRSRDDGDRVLVLLVECRTEQEAVAARR